MRPVTFLVAVLAVAPLLSVAAQEDPFRPRRPGRVKPGDRVRVWAPEFGVQKWVGTLRALRGDTLTVDKMRFAFASVTRLEVRRGGKSHALAGAAIGGVIGAVSGAVGGAASCADSFVDPGGCALLGGLVFGAGGALLGAVVGALAKTDRWQEVPLAFLRVSFAPHGDGHGSQQGE